MSVKKIKYPGKRMMDLIMINDEDEFEIVQAVRYLVYALLNDEKIIYIGVTCNLKTRIYDHVCRFDFDRVVILKDKMQKQEAFYKEREYINLLSEFFDLANKDGNSRL